MKTLVLLITLLFLISGCAKIIDCKKDIECFKNNAQTCSKSKFLLSNKGNDVLITLRGMSSDKCPVSFKVIELGEATKKSYPVESAGVKGKTLNCLIPVKYKDTNNWQQIIDINQNIDDYCSGQIKDLMKGPLKSILINKFNNVIN